MFRGSPFIRSLKIVFLSFGIGLGMYFIGLFGCLWLLPLLSSNSHDGGVEAAMTGALLVGPFLALAGFVGGVIFLGKSRSGRQ
jgi:hypothetical protein